MFHIRFGRIIGMSTRKGEVVFLEDVLEEAKERAIKAAQSTTSLLFILLIINCLFVQFS